MSKKNALRLVFLLTLGIGVSIVYHYRNALSVESLQSAIPHAGLLAPLAFIGLYTLAAILFLPGSVFTIAGGALFGPAAGTVYSLLGATLGATFAFLIARHLASEWVQRKAGGRLKQLIEGVADEGWRFVAFVRLVPLIPFNLLNYALGLTRIRLLHYTLASFVCMAPGALAYSYLGYAGREALTGSEQSIRQLLLALALLAVVVFLPRFIRRFRKASAKARTS